MSDMRDRSWNLLFLLLLVLTTSARLDRVVGFVPSQCACHKASVSIAHSDTRVMPESLSFFTNQRNKPTKLYEMKRPIPDQVASWLFRLENDRVAASSEVDDKGRWGEPMEWSNSDSAANKFSVAFSSNPIGYRFKQWIADMVAGNDFEQDAVNKQIDQFIQSNDVAMFSFSTCPFCRRAKDALEQRGIPYVTMELDLLTDDNRGNIIRAVLGRRTQRTSMPSIYIRGQFIGGCNDGNPGLLPLMQSGELDRMLKESGQS